MDEFERMFSRLPWRRPSAGLRSRIFGEARHGLIRRVLGDRRIAAGWAAGLALTAGTVGYLLGTVGRGGQSTRPVLAGASVELRIIETNSRRNFFDLTGGTGDIWPGELTLKVQEREEAEG